MEYPFKSLLLSCGTLILIAWCFSSSLQSSFTDRKATHFKFGGIVHLNSGLCKECGVQLAIEREDGNFAVIDSTHVNSAAAFFISQPINEFISLIETDGTLKKVYLRSYVINKKNTISHKRVIIKKEDSSWRNLWNPDYIYNYFDQEIQVWSGP